jgi:CHASE3 domain sensor protein
MKNEAAKLLNWIVYRSAPFIAVSLAIYAIWFSHTALMPFMQLRRVIAIEERLQGALFQTESIQRGFLLTHDETELGLYEKSKGNLRALVTLLEEQLSNKAEKKTGADIEAVVELKIVEMDQTITQGKTGDFGEAIKIVKTNVGRRYSQQICDDLLVIRGLESGSTYQR